MDGFETFWNAYPRKVAKAEARKAWKQTEAIRPDMDTLLHAIKAACKTEQWMKSGGAFIPYPATWLRGERWDDELSVSLPERPWHETASGIEAKGKEFGLEPSQFNTFPEFRAAVMQKSLKAA